MLSRDKYPGITDAIMYKKKKHPFGCFSLIGGEEELIFYYRYAVSCIYVLIFLEQPGRHRATSV